MSTLRVIGIIPARGGSKSVAGKNLRHLGGKPLIVWTIEAALATTALDKVIVSTDDEEIADVAAAHGAEVPFLRPSNLAEDDTPTRPVLAHAVDWLAREEKYSVDVVATLQPTSPFRGADHIDEAVRIFQGDPTAESLVSCVPVPHNFLPESLMQTGQDGYLLPYEGKAWVTRRQDKQPMFARNGPAICLTRTECLGHFVFGGRLLLYVMDERSSIDIDSLDDFDRAEKFLGVPE